MRYHRTTGLELSQMQELAVRVHGALPKPWNRKRGRPKSCGLYRAVEIACMYLRQNVTQEFLGDLCGISQPTVSRIVSTLVPVVKAVLEEFVPTAAEALESVNGRVCLVDGTITPCWSYAERDELWSRKHGSTRNWSVCSTGPPSTFLIPLPAAPTTRKLSPRLRWPISSPLPVAESPTRATKAAAWSPREKTPRWRAQRRRQEEQRGDIRAASTR